MIITTFDIRILKILLDNEIKIPKKRVVGYNVNEITRLVKPISRATALKHIRILESNKFLYEIGSVEPRKIGLPRYLVINRKPFLYEADADYIRNVIGRMIGEKYPLSELSIVYDYIGGVTLTSSSVKKIHSGIVDI